MKRNQQAHESKIDNAGRGKPCKQRPWLWMEKAILRMIRDVFDATNDVSSALAVSVALAEIGSDEQSDTFTKSIREIAGRAGASYKSAARILSRFEALKIIAVERNKVPGTKEHAPSTYTLCTLGNDYPTLGNDRIPPSFPRMMNNKKKSKKNDVEKPARAHTRARGTINAQAVASSAQKSDFVFESYQNQNQPVQSHVKWPEFTAWCRSKGGQPTEAGFWKWLCGQKPQWRNKVRKDFDETGYVLDGKFLTPDEANRLGTADPDQLVKFQPAVKRDGKIQIIESH
jgi:hypothetical protein